MFTERKSHELTLRSSHVVDGALGEYGHTEITRADNEMRIVCGSDDNPHMFENFTIDRYAIVNGLRIITRLWNPERLLTLVRGLTVALYTSKEPDPLMATWKKGTRQIYFPGAAILDKRMGRWEIGHNGERVCNLWTMDPAVIDNDTRVWIVMTLDNAALEVFHEIERSPTPEKFVSVEVKLLGDVIEEHEFEENYWSKHGPYFYRVDDRFIPAKQTNTRVPQAGDTLILTDDKQSRGRPCQVEDVDPQTTLLKFWGHVACEGGHGAVSGGPYILVDGPVDEPVENEES